MSSAKPATELDKGYCCVLDSLTLTGLRGLMFQEPPPTPLFFSLSLPLSTLSVCKSFISNILPSWSRRGGLVPIFSWLFIYSLLDTLMILLYQLVSTTLLASCHPKDAKL